MQLHDPFTGTTQSQRLAAAARSMRLGRIAAKAKRDPLPVVALEEIAPQPMTVVDWVKRQEKLNPLPKKPWFEIIEEIAPAEPLRPTVEQIQRAVCRHFNMPRGDLISERRHGPMIMPRHIAVYLCKMLTLRSLPEIGRRFGHRDHTTMIHAVRKIAALITVNPILSAEVELLKLKIAEQIA